MKNKLMLMIGIVLLVLVSCGYVSAVAPNQPTLNSPANNTLLNLTYTMLNLTVTDDDSSNMNISFYNSTSNWIEWTYTGTNYSVSEGVALRDIFWNGTRWFIVATQIVYEYYPNWTYTGINHNLALNTINGDVPKSIYWNGTNWWVLGNNKDTVYKFYSNWTYTEINHSIQSEDTFPKDIFWDGTNWWMAGSDNDKAFKYYSNWTYTGTSYSITGGVDNIFWDGTYWWTLDWSNKKIYKYDIDWTYTGTSYSISSQSSDSRSIYWNETNWFLLDATNEEVYLYSGATLINTTLNIANGSYATYNWTGLTNNHNYNWYITVTDGTNIINSSVYTFSVYNYSYAVGYTTPVLETSSQTFTLNITRNSTYISNGNATLRWNSTAYAVNAVVYPTYLWFSKTLTMPSVTNNTNITFNWSYTLQSFNAERTSDYTQTIYNIDIDDCSTYSIVTLNFSLIEESNNASIAGDMDFTFSLVQEDITINYSKSVTNVSSTAFCIPTNEVSFTAQLQSEYTASAYSDFTYFAYDMSITNTTQYIYYYLTNGTTIVEFTVLDQSGNKIENAYIKVMKYNIGTGLYKTTEVLKTDELGKALGNIVLDTAWYKFMVEYGGTLYLHTSATKMTSTTRTFTINLLSDFFDRYTDVIYNIYSTLNFTDATGNFAFTYSDPSGDYHEGCLRVTKEGLAGQTLINETCVSSTAATILVNIHPAGGAVNGTYTAVGYVMFDDMYVLRTMSETWGHLSDVYGKEGLFYVFLIVLTAVMVGIFSPKLAIILGIIGLVFSNILGFVFINVGWLVAIIIAAGLTIYRMRD